MVSKYTKLLKEKIKENQFVVFLFLIAAAFFLILFGITGLRTFLGFVLLFFLPTYLIFKNFDLEPEEKIAFSFFIGLGVFPTCAYYLGLLFSSMILAILISFILLMAIAIIFNLKYSKHRRKGFEEKE